MLCEGLLNIEKYFLMNNHMLLTEVMLLLMTVSRLCAELNEMEKDKFDIT